MSSLTSHPPEVKVQTMGQQILWRVMRWPLTLRSPWRPCHPKTGRWMSNLCHPLENGCKTMAWRRTAWTCITYCHRLASSTVMVSGMTLGKTKYISLVNKVKRWQKTFSVNIMFFVQALLINTHCFQKKKKRMTDYSKNSHRILCHGLIKCSTML